VRPLMEKFVCVSALGFGPTALDLVAVSSFETYDQSFACRFFFRKLNATAPLRTLTARFAPPPPPPPAPHATWAAERRVDRGCLGEKDRCRARLGSGTKPVSQ